MKAILIKACAFLLLWVPLWGQAQQQAFSGVFQRSDRAHIQLFEVSWEDLKEKNTKLGADGYELIDVEAYVTPRKTSFYAIWREGGKPVRLERAGGWENMIKLRQKLQTEGFVLGDVEGFLDGEGREIFVGLWKKGSTEQKLWKLDTWAALDKQSQDMARQYFQLVDIEAFTSKSGASSFLILYHKLPPTERAYPLQFDEVEAFYKEKEKRNKSGYLLIDYETYDFNGQTFMAGLFKKTKGEDNCRHRLDWNSFLSYQQFLGESFRLVDLEISNGKGEVLAPPFRRDRLKDTPNIPQEVISAQIKAADPSDQSAPCAAANALVWLSKHGFPNLVAPADTSQRYATLSRNLAGPAYMKSLQASGASPYQVIDGLIKYLAERKYQVSELGVQTIRPFDASRLQPSPVREHIQLEEKVDHVTLEFAQEGLVGSSIVLLQLGIYEPMPGDSLNRLFRRSGTRWATLVGYGINEHGNKNPSVLIVHSPSHGGEAPLYLRVKALDAHIKLPAEAKLLLSPQGEKGPTLPAGQQRMLEDALQDPGKQFALWEGTVVLKLREVELAAANK